MAATTLQISDRDVQQYRDEGYFILERALPEHLLAALQAECDAAVEAKDREMEQTGKTSEGITHYRKRYFIGNRSQTSERLRRVLFSDVYAEICRATIGPEAHLFCEQFVVKAGEPDTRFSWHQD